MLKSQRFGFKLTEHLFIENLLDLEAFSRKHKANNLFGKSKNYIYLANLYKDLFGKPIFLFNF